MAKVKKFAVGGVSSLGDLISGGPTNQNNSAASATGASSSPAPAGAEDSLSQIDSATNSVRSAIGAAQDALGSASNSYKKGGAVKKYTLPGGRLNLKSVGASTAQKSKTKSSW